MGFGPDDDYDEVADDIDVVESEPTTLAPAAVAESVEGLSEVPTLPEISPDMKAKIFDGAVAVFNSTLPDFLKRSVDPKAQARLLAESIDRGVDEFLNGLMLKAEQYAEGKLKTATEQAQRESEKLRADVQQIEQQRTQLREQQLSADRRRRALSERVADLEGQLAKVEAEREQFELENRSLLNKLKVADIQNGGVEELHRHIEDLQAQLAQKAPAEPVVDSDAIERLTSERDTAIVELEKYKAETAKYKDDSEKYKAESEKHMQDNADLRTQQEMSQAMYNDLQNQYGSERDARRKAQSELEEAKKIISDMNELQQQMEKVEMLIHSRDERIAKLKASNKKLREQAEADRHTIDELRSRSRDNGLFDAAVADGDDDGHAMDMATIEEEFECPDWFVSEPAPGEVSPMLQPSHDFGYQEPPKKPKRPENDAQLSLF